MIECVACGKKNFFLYRGAVCCLGDWVTHRCIYCPGVNTNPPPRPSLQHGYLFVVQKGSFYSLNVTDIEHSLMGQKAVATDVIAIDSI